MSRIPSSVRSGNNGRSRSLITTSAVVDGLGGTLATARLTGRVKSAPSQWRKRGKFPPSTFLIMAAALETRGLSASPALWSQVPGPRSNPVKAEAGAKDDLWSPGGLP
jgi:hypothetical protein